MYYYEEDRLTRVERIKRQEEEIYNIIINYFSENKYSPTIREILMNSTLKSTSTVKVYLSRLQKKGLIDWEPSKPRTIKILEKSSL